MILAMLRVGADVLGKTAEQGAQKKNTKKEPIS